MHTQMYRRLHKSDYMKSSNQVQKRCLIMKIFAIYYIKTKIRLSVGTFLHARSSVVSPRINARFTRNEAPVIKEHEVSF